MGGCVILPGFFDAHNHQPTAARDVGQVRTAHAKNLGELRSILAGAAGRLPAGRWVTTEHALSISQLGRTRLPTAYELDAVTPDHPVAVRFGAHTMVLNSLGLTMCGVASLAGDPPNGVIDRDPRTGAPTGALREYGAIRLVLEQLSAPGDLVERMRSVQREYAVVGLTSVRVPGLRPGDLGIYQRLLDADGRLANRVVGGPRLDPTADQATKLAAIAHQEPGSPWLRPDAVKIFVDVGIETILSGTEHLFLDLPDLVELVGAAIASGWSVTCHAVTSRAVDLVLDAYAAVGPAPSGGAVRAIEHGFFATSDQLMRAGRLGVWLSTQPAIAMVEGALVAERARGLLGTIPFPLRTALRHGVRCALGSDWNAAPGTMGRPFAPLESIRLAVRQLGRVGELDPDELIDVSTAIYLHTRAPAELAGCTDRGGIWPGALADFVLLSGNPLVDLSAVQVAGVVVDGRRLEL